MRAVRAAVRVGGLRPRRGRGRAELDGRLYHPRALPACAGRRLETPRTWRRAFFTDYANEGAAYLRIDAEDPETLLGVSPARLVAAQRTSSAERETFDRLQMANGFPWCVAGAPIAAWARKVFPDRSEGDAVAALWDAILKTVRVTGDGNPEARWREHIALLTARK